MLVEHNTVIENVSIIQLRNKTTLVESCLISFGIVLESTRLHPQGKGGPEGTTVQSCPDVAEQRKNTIIQNRSNRVHSPAWNEMDPFLDTFY